ncbi:MAG TPA: DUF4105 domain-containing protein [Solimonas sp.]|nr:DUF4105 domain-containing protein [Solimonas sp.]
MGEKLGGALLRLLACWQAAWQALRARLRPSNDRDWRIEESVLASATVEGDLLHVRNVRNFEYRSRTDFTPDWYDRSYDLRELDSVDLVACYWMGAHVAHVFLSFGFAGREHLAISIEARKQQGQGYSSLRGFFREYQLIYVVADERDLVRQRSNHRRNPSEEVYLYRLKGTQETARRLLLEYVSKINSLHQRPEFYNTLTTNCTSNIWLHAHVDPGRPPLSWRVLLSGHVPRYLYDCGGLERSLPFEELRRRSHINARALAAESAPDFSQRIRQGLP